MTRKTKRPRKPADPVVQLWACRSTAKGSGWVPDRVIVLLEGRPGPVGVLMVCGWTATSTVDYWHAKRLEKNMKAIAGQWEELHGKGWKLETETT